MSKAGIYVANTKTQAVAAGGTIALGATVRRYGNDRCCNPVINLTGNGITLNEPGYYNVDVNVTDEPTAAGAVTVTLYQDGMPVTGAVASNTAAAGSDATAVAIPATVRVLGCNSSILTVVLTAGAGNMTNAAVRVIKVKD